MTACLGRLFSVLLAVAWRILIYAQRNVAPGARGRRVVIAGECLASLLEDLGPTYIKLGQILSCRPDLLSPDFTTQLGRLRDDLRPIDSRQVGQLLLEGLGRAPAEVFAGFERVPVAAGSVAQVHRARLHDGREVAVKIRRPGIVKLVAADFALLEAVASLLSRLPFLRGMPMVELVAEIRGPVEMQLDFRIEAAANRRLRRMFPLAEHIKIPDLVDGLCSASVLTMEFMSGMRSTSSGDLSASRRQAAALAGLRALYKMVFLEGFVHADMHPANIFLGGSGQLVLLDTGLMAELSERERENFVDFFFGLVNNEGLECARIVLEMALNRPSETQMAGFERAMCELVSRHSALKSRDFEVTRFVYELIETQRKYGIRGSTAFIMTILSMVVYDGICKQLYPECDFQAEARPYLIVGRYARRAS